MNLTMADRIIRLAVLIAFDDALMEDAQMTIVCYVGTDDALRILPLKDYPSMIPRHASAG